ncbi:hypothetical protein [Nostoc piscinale]|nr:hypothetical protein [Nostoc piscinale]
MNSEKPRSYLNEAMLALMIMFLMIPFAALTLKAAVEIVRSDQCPMTNKK